MPVSGTLDSELRLAEGEGGQMADTSVQREVERWLRESWLPTKYRQPFSAKPLRLSSGGSFDFDGVSQDGDIAVTISTSGAQTASGKRGSGKLQKIRADALFLLLAQTKRSVLVFTEPDMFRLCQKEAENGRLPTSLEFVLTELPTELRGRLEEARRKASAEVSPDKVKGSNLLLTNS